MMVPRPVRQVGENGAMCRSPANRHWLLAIAALGVAAATSGCALVTPGWFRHQERVSTILIDQLHQGAMPGGFRAEVEVDPGCGYGVDCQDPNAAFNAWRDGPFNHTSVCTTIIDYAKRNGATSWWRDPEYVIHSFTDKTVMPAYPECVMLMSQASAVAGSVGFTLFGIDSQTQAPLAFTLTATQAGGAHSYHLNVRTIYSDPSVTQDITTQTAPASWVALQTLLNAVATERTSPEAPLTIDQGQAAIAAYPGTASLVTGADGFVHAIDVASDGIVAAQCISVDPWNEEVTGIPDPGAPYDIFYTQTVLSPSVGMAVMAPCASL